MQNGCKMACNVKDHTNISDCRKSVFSIKQHKTSRQNATLTTSRQQRAQKPWNQTFSHLTLTIHTGTGRKDLLSDGHYICIRGQRHWVWQGHEVRRHNSNQSRTPKYLPHSSTPWMFHSQRENLVLSMCESKNAEVGKPEMVASLTSRAQDVTVSFPSPPPSSDHQMLTSILLHHSYFASNHMDLILSLALLGGVLLWSIGSARFTVTEQCAKMCLPFTDCLQRRPLILTKDKPITSVNVRISSFSLSCIYWGSLGRREISLILHCFGLLRTPGG